MTLQISIVVPAFNAERYLAPTLDSVLAQMVPDWELIVVNDGSRDATAEIAARYAARDPRIRLVSQANAGVSAARNFGAALAHSQSKFLIFLDADDVWEPDALAVLRASLKAHPDAPAAYGLARYIGKNGEPIEPGVCEGHQTFRLGLERGRVIVWPPGRPTTFAVEAIMERVMTCGTVLMRREAFGATGKFDPALRMWEDWDFWLRLTHACGGLVFTETLVLGYRRHDANVSGQRDLLEAGEWQVRRKLLETVRDHPAHFRMARQALAYRHRCALSHHLHAAKSYGLRGHPAAALREAAAAARHGRKFLQARRAGIARSMP